MKTIILSLFIWPTFVVASQSMTQTVRFEHGKIKIEGSFPWFPATALELKGTDESNKPYQLKIQTSSGHDHGYFDVSYDLDYLGKKSKGSILAAVGEASKLESKEDRKQATIFEIKLVN